MKKSMWFGPLMVLVIGVAASSAESAAAIDAASDGKTKINLSGRQRMLSQRMAKAVCFSAVNVQPENHLGMLKDAHALFQRTLDGLSSGDEAQGMLPENDPEIVANLAEVSALWADYRMVNELIMSSGGVTEAQLATVARVNVPVLKQMHKTVGVIEKVYGSSGDVHPALALALNISGRQRMLSQKASKEFCLIGAEIDVDANRAALRETVQLFTRSLDGLIVGDPAIALAPAPTPEIQAQLVKVRDMWGPLHKVFLRVINGNAPTPEEMDMVATANNPVLKEMNTAVFMYNEL